jgi:hypothetical protein
VALIAYFGSLATISQLTATERVSPTGISYLVGRVEPLARPTASRCGTVSGRSWRQFAKNITIVARRAGADITN